MDGPPAGADRQLIMQFMTTEHFTLQTARAVVNAEISARLQLYMTTLSSSIIALALVAQVSGVLGRAFEAFALVLLPVVYFLGVVTLARLLQASAEWRTYGQGMNRIRHWYTWRSRRRWRPTSCCRPPTTPGPAWPRSASAAGGRGGGC
ncbi:MAG: hypothetical protein ACJ75K_00030 [Actinomycetes bacterium]